MNSEHASILCLETKPHTCLLRVFNMFPNTWKRRKGNIKQQIHNFILIWNMQDGILKGKMEQKKSGWDKSNQKIRGDINVFLVKTCLRQSFEMGF